MESSRFIFDRNAQQVIKVTDGHVTGYIAASIPQEALQNWHRRLIAQLKRIQRLKFRVRPHKRPRSKPKRVRRRRQRLQKRHRAPRKVLDPWLASIAQMPDCSVAGTAHT